MPRIRVAALAAALLALPAPLWAHGGHAEALAWQADPPIVILLAAGAALYAAGIARLWREAGIGTGVPRWRAACFTGGLLAVVLALLSPLDALGDQLFAAHMIQHLVLILIAAPLLVLGAPALVLLWALPGGARRRTGEWWRTGPLLPRLIRVLTRPAAAWGLAVGALLFWHMPGPFQAALGSDTVHAAEHLSFLGTAALFWWVVLQPVGRRQLGHGGAILYVFTAGLVSSGLGALLTFAVRPWYPLQTGGFARFGLTPLEDQQVAGLVMWIPAGLIYLGAAAWLFVAWLRADERADERRERSFHPALGERMTQQQRPRSRAVVLAWAALALAGLGTSSCGHEIHAARSVEGGDPAMGKALIVSYGCGACHVIPGVDNAHGMVGPPLTHFGQRVYIAGEVANTPQYLIRWITVPQAIEPGTAMPNLGVTDAQARDIAAYLYTLQ